MDKECKNIDLYLTLLILVLFCTNSFVYLNFSKSTMLDFFMLGLFFVIIILSYFKGVVWGLLISIVSIFFYGSHILFNNVVSGNVVEISTYVWMVAIPLGSFLGGNLSLNIENMQKINANLKKQYNEFITIDEVTGLNNIKGFYMDLDREISKCKRHRKNISLMVIKLNYYNQLRGILGETRMAQVLKQISYCIISFTRNEDIKYKISEDTLAILMDDTDEKGAEVVKDRIKEGIRELNLKINEKNINIELKIGIIQYNTSIENSFRFMELAEKELEYHVD